MQLISNTKIKNPNVTDTAKLKIANTLKASTHTLRVWILWMKFLFFFMQHRYTRALILFNSGFGYSSFAPYRSNTSVMLTRQLSAASPRGVSWRYECSKQDSRSRSAPRTTSRATESKSPFSVACLTKVKLGRWGLGWLGLAPYRISSFRNSLGSSNLSTSVIGLEFSLSSYRSGLNPDFSITWKHLRCFICRAAISTWRSGSRITSGVSRRTSSSRVMSWISSLQVPGWMYSIVSLKILRIGLLF